MPTVDFSFWPFPPVSCFSGLCAALTTSRRVSCAELELSLEDIEYETNFCRSSLRLHTRGGGYRRWTLPSWPLSQEAAASLSISLLPARRLRRILDALPCQRPQLQPAVHEAARSNPTRFDASQDAVIYRVARAALRCRVVRASWRGSAQSR